MDLTPTIAPRSDQLNYDDVASTSVTVTVSEVRKGTAEQPVEIHLVEYPGRPFKPSKTVRRVLVLAWGSDASVYTGRRITLFGDPTVKWAGEAVGGIRVSHLSHIDKALKIPLTVSRGKRQTALVQPLADAPPPAPMISRAQWEHLQQAHGGDTLAWVQEQLGRELGGPQQITATEAEQLKTALEGAE